MRDHSETVIDITVPSAQLGAAPASAEELRRERIYDGYWGDRPAVEDKSAGRPEPDAAAVPTAALENAAKAAANAARWAMWAAFAAALAAVASLIATLMR